MDSGRRNVSVVGFFIVIGILIFIAAIFVVGGQLSLFEKTTDITARFTNVSGLLSGDNVWLSGVKVGTVKHMDFNKDGSVSVLMRIENDFVPFIHRDAFAKIGSDGLVGNRIVVLEGGSQQAPCIRNGDQLKVITPLSNEVILSTLQKNNLNLVEITQSLKKVSKSLSEGNGTVGKLLSEEGAYEDLTKALSTLAEASNHINLVAKNLQSYSSGFHSKGSFANDLVTDTAVFAQLRLSGQKMAETFNATGIAAQNLALATEKLNAGNNTLNTLLSDSTMSNKLRSAISNMENSSKKLNETLTALQQSIFFRRYFRKKNQF